jgi:3-phosphoinositide dependent protein kinase-1
MAPECIHNKASDKASDIYSLAGVFYFLKVGQPPFTGGSEYLIFKKALESIIYLPPQIFSKAEQNLLLKMTEKDWSSRISIEDVMNQV